MHLDLHTTFDIGQLVYRRADTNMAGIVCGFCLNPQLVVSYAVSWNDGECTTCYDIELTDEKEFGS